MEGKQVRFLLEKEREAKYEIKQAQNKENNRNKKENHPLY